MAIALRALGSGADNSTNPTTSFTIILPPGIILGDNIFVFGVSRDATSSDSLPTCTDNDTGGNAWTNVFDAPSNTGGQHNIFVYWKKATITTATKTVTVSGCINSTSGGCITFSGAYSGGNPSQDFTFEFNASGDESQAGFTPTYANSAIVIFIAPGNDTTPPSAVSCTNPGTMTEQFNAVSNGGNDCGAYGLTGFQSGGPTATGTFNWTQTNQGGWSVAFSVRPEVAVGGGPLIDNGELLNAGSLVRGRLVT